MVVLPRLSSKGSRSGDLPSFCSGSEQPSRRARQGQEFQGFSSALKEAPFCCR